MPKLEGTLAVTGLPPHRGLIVSLCFFQVSEATAPAPYDGDPPAEAVTDCQEVFQQVNLQVESPQSEYELPFTTERPAGFYYLQVRVLLLRIQAGAVVAQAEQFFFGHQPLPLTEALEGQVILPVEWPQIPLEELGSYGTIEPRQEG